MKIGLIIVLLLFVGVAVFATQNAGPVGVTVLGWHGKTTLALVVFGAAACGALAVLIAEVGPGLRSRRRLRALQAQIAELTAQNTPPPAPAQPSATDADQAPEVS